MVVSKRQIFFSCHKEIHENEHFLSSVFFFRYGMEAVGLATMLHHFNSRGQEVCVNSEGRLRQTFNFLYRQVGLLIWAFNWAFGLALLPFQVGLTSYMFEPAF